MEIKLGASDYINLIEELEDINGDDEAQATLNLLERYGIRLKSTKFESEEE